MALWTNIFTEFGELRSPNINWKCLQQFEMPDFVINYKSIGKMAIIYRKLYPCNKHLNSPYNCTRIVKQTDYDNKEGHLSSLRYLIIKDL